MPHHVITLTGIALLALLALGLNLQLRPGARRAALWPHHALFFLVCAGTALSVLLTARAGGRAWALLPALLALLSMPRTRPGSAGHWQRALLCAALYAAGAALAWTT